MWGDRSWSLEHCSNTELLSQLETILSSSRRLTAEVIAHLGEVEGRRLHLEAACSSMFDYCVRRLGLSEDEACRRIEVARLARRFPALFPLLASGELSLTVAAVLKPYLDDENHEHVLMDALKAKLDQARDLMRHRNPAGDLAPIVERALDLLLERLMKERFGETQSPRKRKVTGDRVTNATRRTVIARDGVQCTWVDDHGQRCPAHGWLELDHRHPRGRGGGSEDANVRVLCRNHDRLAAEQAYGRETIEWAIARRHVPRST